MAGDAERPTEPLRKATRPLEQLPWAHGLDSLLSEANGLVCARCGHHTGNDTQGHYWKWCKVTARFERFHFCCPDDVLGCELQAS